VEVVLVVVVRSLALLALPIQVAAVAVAVAQTLVFTITAVTVVEVLSSSLMLVHNNGLVVPIAHQAETQYIPILVKEHLHLLIILHT
jgi:hypothetical protein